MLELVVLPPAFGLQNVSPYCLKAEMLLTSLELPFTKVLEPDPRKTPKGKLPYLRADGETIGDSELITEYLDGLTHGAVYEGIADEHRAQGVAYARLVEDHLYWMLVASRWLDPDWFPHVVDGFFGIAPKLVRGFVARGAQKQTRQTYLLHGLGKHTLAEQKGFAERDLVALEAAVEVTGRQFLFGDTPNIFDFTVASQLAGIFDQQPASWITEVAAPFNALRAYTERVQAHVGVYAREQSAVPD